ncbi:branched-chain amino acid ABC transporter [Paenibacillus yonginensis]|uniref:Branched-chain amino acid ABC transporter n=1 Tax=Paenibacillus yonginensis TaxID=1462996 RepID=A0A1B1MZ13_9BACL|nr:AzlD domain-containing protein [Paenibacillus yonginensis]ANS74398.1 branched-chain amino acid ABC transporter [Paenibacillus yonginensis]
MEIRWEVFLMIVGASIVTLIPRVLPLVLLSRIQIPEWGMRWLNFVPVAVMAALIGQELLVQDGKLSFGAEVIAALPAVAAAVLTRSLLATVIVGMLAMMALRFFL